MTKEEAKKLRKDAIELFNQIAILLKDVEHEDDETYVEGKREFVENPNFYPENRFLLTLKNIATDIADAKEDGEVMDYYSSYCW